MGLSVKSCVCIFFYIITVVYGEVRIIGSPGISRLCQGDVWIFSWNFENQVDPGLLGLTLGKYNSDDPTNSKIPIYNWNLGTESYSNGYSEDKLKANLDSDIPRVDFEMQNIDSSDVGLFYIEVKDISQTEPDFNHDSGLYVFSKPVQPFIEPKGGAITVEDGDSTTIICATKTKIITTNLNGDAIQPQFIYTWYKENKVVMSGNSNRYIIDTSQDDHKTQYYCTIQDGMCPDTISENSDVITVLVRHTPATPTLQIDNPEDATVGGSILLTCDTGLHTGYPTDVHGYSFYLNGVVIVNTTYNEFNISELTEDNFGNYQCSIKNEVGESVWSEKVPIGIPPESGISQLFIIIIVVGAVVVFIAIIIIVIVVRRRSGPSKPTASKVPKKYAAAAKGATKFEYKPVPRKSFNVPIPDITDNNENISEKEKEKDNSPIYQTVDETRRKTPPPKPPRLSQSSDGKSPVPTPRSGFNRQKSKDSTTSSDMNRSLDRYREPISPTRANLALTLEPTSPSRTNNSLLRKPTSPVNSIPPGELTRRTLPPGELCRSPSSGEPSSPARASSPLSPKMAQLINKFSDNPVEETSSPKKWK